MPCSRREAEQYIAEGWVRVDGTVVEEPQFRVAAPQQVVVDRQVLQPASPATLLLHKPAGLAAANLGTLLGSATRWSGDSSGIRHVRHHEAGLVALLPLPDQASGLCVLSQDRRIIRRLQEDADWIEQELVADVAGTIAAGGLARLCHGLARDGKPLPPARVSWQSETRLRFAMKGTPPGWIPWMCEQVGLSVTALRRLRIGRVPMAGLPSGQWRHLPAGERF